MIAMRIDYLRTLIRSGCLAMAVALVGCGGSQEPREAARRADPEVGQQKTGNVDPAKIEKCGGFTADLAAGILGVPASQIKATNEPQSETLRICSFQAGSDWRKVVSFSLSSEPSADEAKASMATERENLGLAKSSIGAVTGSTDESAALEEIPGLGDEAFYTRVNETLVARVSNVRVQVMTAPNLEAYKQVAREVTRGLR